MNPKIDTKQKICFYDDRRKAATLIMDKILFENDELCLCTSIEGFYIEQGIELYYKTRETYIILFDKITGYVLTNNFSRHIADNYNNNPKT